VPRQPSVTLPGAMPDATRVPPIAETSSDASPDVRVASASQGDRSLVALPGHRKLALANPWRGAARDYLILLAGIVLITVAVVVIQG